MTWLLAAGGLGAAAACLCAAGWAASGRGAWRVAGAHLRRTLQTAASYRLRMAMAAVNTVLAVALLTLVARGVLLPALGDALRGSSATVAYLAVGVAAWPAAWAGYQSSSSTLRREQMLGTLEVLAATPAGLEALPFASLVTQGAGSLAVAGATIAVLAFLLPLGLAPTPDGVVLAVAALAMGALFLWGVGLLVGALAALYKEVSGVDSLLRFGLLLLSGAYIPLALMPGGLGAAGELLPLSASFQVVRDALGAGADPLPTTIRMGYLAGACLLAAAAGARTMSWSLARARRTGRLQGY